MRHALQPLFGDLTDEVLREYRRIERVVEAEQPFRRYRGVLAEALGRAAVVVGVRVPNGESHVLSETLPEWPLFADTDLVLQRLRDFGLRIAVLSNVDDDLIAGTLRQLTVDFDEIVTAEQVRSYKPADAHLVEFQRRSGVGRRGWIHAGASWFHDVEPARRLGIEVVYVNRQRTDVPDSSAWIVENLRELPDAVLDIFEGRN
jgi:2-haloacid dehalogenase